MIEKIQIDPKDSEIIKKKSILNINHKKISII